MTAVFILLLLLATSAPATSTRSSSFIGRNTKTPLINLPLLKTSIRRNKQSINSFPPKSFSIPRGGNRHTLEMTASGIIFNNAPLFQSIGIFSGLNLLGFVISLATGSHLHLDLLGTGAFALAALPPLIAKGAVLTRVQFSCTAMIIWGTKLAGFLFFRALQVKRDARLNDTLSTTTGTAVFWIISILWGIACSLPHTLGTTSSAEGNTVTLATGTVLYTMGLIIESLADYQKWTFKQTNPAKFCNVGLWSISQHPNWLGNLMLWTGIFIMNSTALIAPIPQGAGLWQIIVCSKRLLISMLSPMFLFTLFSGQANGSITNAVQLATERYGSDPSFMEYVKKVPLIFPKLFRGGK